MRTPFGPLTPEMGIQMLRFVEWNARISHRSEEAQTEDSWKRFLEAVVMQKSDWSVVEHASVTAVMRLSRGTTHELVRHRLFSYTQESTRFVNYGKGKIDLEFILPAECSEKGSQFHLTALELEESYYLELLKDGWRPQEARSVLPNATAATISCTGNLRNWRHFFLMRCSRETHPDFRQITIPLLGEFQRCIPLLYSDIIPNESQAINQKKAR